MKFRFCGDLEPPAWLLAEIPCIAQSVQNGVDLDVVTGAIVSAIVKAASYDEVLDHLIAAVGEVDAKAILVSIKWILVHAAKYNVQEGVLLSEVQQLGLPSGVAGTLASVFHLHQQTLRRHLQLHNHLVLPYMSCTKYSTFCRHQHHRRYLANGSCRTRWRRKQPRS
ncbi:hypothetical protein, variant [Aphanomyces astaci]|uniref:Uncharacterized protein n=1 Tax=Aphanomyces astaci TaxID=112090 RepID=W4GKE6_APHAT|nr:hypothetical protein, variant [Aphanomyces astaci]ETV79826.1 hypothetical protein, variant [Aphanomyces astaci]|eukprot:XP_009830762.1 hypothetical protein, variant [Aphanomyces astaci]